MKKIKICVGGPETLTPETDSELSKILSESSDKSPTFTPVKRYNGYTLLEIRAHLGFMRENDLDDETLIAICKLLTEPRK